MNASEFKQVLKDLGKRDVTDQQVVEMLKQVDRNNDNLIQWSEFVEVRKHAR
jgi:Ca2+-binding EF-hand superfamily protein